MSAHWIGSTGLRTVVASAAVLPILAVPGSQADGPTGPVSSPVVAVQDGAELPLLADAQTSKPFTIRGVTGGPLVIGASVPIVLTISNPNRHAITIRELSVAVGTVKPSSPGAHCGAGDFAVRQVSGGTRLIVPAGRIVDFAGLGVPANQLPQISMVNRAAVNQDGCKGATVTLVAHGSVTGGLQ
jgi:hypothetical protein